MDRVGHRLLGGPASSVRVFGSRWRSCAALHRSDLQIHLHGRNRPHGHRLPLLPSRFVMHQSLLTSYALARTSPQVASRSWLRAFCGRYM
jgi:hypothetical protein